MPINIGRFHRSVSSGALVVRDDSKGMSFFQFDSNCLSVSRKLVSRHRIMIMVKVCGAGVFEVDFIQVRFLLFHLKLVYCANLKPVKVNIMF